MVSAFCELESLFCFLEINFSEARVSAVFNFKQMCWSFLGNQPARSDFLHFFASAKPFGGPPPFNSIMRGSIVSFNFLLN